MYVVLFKSLMGNARDMSSALSC